MTAIQQLMGLTARPLGRRCNGAGWGGEGGSAAVGSPTGAAGEERGKECSRGIAHRRCLGRGGGGLQPWDRPQAPQERGEGGAQPWDRPLALPGEGGG